MTTKGTQPDALKASIRSFKPAKGRADVVVRLTNDADRALHYIADIRTLRFDADNRRLVIGLSDDGRTVVPGAISPIPEFRYIDPHGTAELHLKVPERIVRFSRSSGRDTVAFKSHSLDNVDQIDVEVGWSEVPYYKDTREDTREQDDRELPASRWQQHKCRTSFKVRRSNR